MVGDVRRLDLNKLGCFELCFCGDVIEHMAAAEARRLTWRLLDRARLLFVSAPLGPCPRGAVNGNPSECHVVADYSDAALRRLVPAVVDGAVDRAGRKAVGVYAMSRDPATIAALVSAARRRTARGRCSGWYAAFFPAGRRDGLFSGGAHLGIEFPMPTRVGI